MKLIVGRFAVDFGVAIVDEPTALDADEGCDRTKVAEEKLRFVGSKNLERNSFVCDAERGAHCLAVHCLVDGIALAMVDAVDVADAANVVHAVDL